VLGAIVVNVYNCIGSKLRRLLDEEGVPRAVEWGREKDGLRALWRRQRPELA
jgi:hypothetical protein